MDNQIYISQLSTLYFSTNHYSKSKKIDIVGSKAKGQISKRVFEESKVRQNFRKTNISGGKKCLFFGNFGVLCSLETPVLRFALLPYHRRCETK